MMMYDDDDDDVAGHWHGRDDHLHRHGSEGPILWLVRSHPDAGTGNQQGRDYPAQPRGAVDRLTMRMLQHVIIHMLPSCEWRETQAERLNYASGEMEPITRSACSFQNEREPRGCIILLECWVINIAGLRRHVLFAQSKHACCFLVELTYQVFFCPHSHILPALLHAVLPSSCAARAWPMWTNPRACLSHCTTCWHACLLLPHKSVR